MKKSKQTVLLACPNDAETAAEEKLQQTAQIGTPDLIAQAEERIENLQAALPTKLPDLKLPKFTGHYASFPAWWAQFVSSVDSRQDLDDVAKLIHLRQFTGGEAYQAISALSVTPASYALARDAMQAQFGKDTSVVHAIINDMQPSVFNSTACTGKTLADIKGHVETLKNLGCEVDKFMAVVLKAIIQEKFKHKHRVAWRTYELSQGAKHQFAITEYLDFIQGQVASEREARGQDKKRSLHQAEFLPRKFIEWERR